MAAARITIRIPEELERKLRKRATAERRSVSDLVRDALEAQLARIPKQDSALDLARELGLIGCVSGATKDLSTNPRHFEGFGKSQ